MYNLLYKVKASLCLSVWEGGRERERERGMEEARASNGWMIGNPSEAG